MHENVSQGSLDLSNVLFNPLSLDVTFPRSVPPTSAQSLQSKSSAVQGRCGWIRYDDTSCSGYRSAVVSSSLLLSHIHALILSLTHHTCRLTCLFYTSAFALLRLGLPPVTVTVLPRWNPTSLHVA
jgi:hypothetical protein